jgi:branched-chain amino acid transport system substrate-binding protein
MHRTSFGLGLAAALLLASSAGAQQTIKVGLILPYSGQFADTATQQDNAIKLYMKKHGDTVAGKKIEIIRKDVGGIAPDVAKRLAQELVTRDNVDILTGLILTPNAMAVSDVSAQAEKFAVIMTGATSIAITRSPYSARVSFTIPQINYNFGKWAGTKGGIKKIYTMVSDYGPGHDGETSFHRGFKEVGGDIIGSVRFPVANPDFSAFVQRAKDLNPEAIFIWIPGGAQPAALGKALAERGIDLKKTKILGQDVSADDTAFKNLGDSAIGIITAAVYDYHHPGKLNQDFVKAYGDEYKRVPDVFSIGGYDGMHLIYETLKKTGGKTDGKSLIAAAKGMKWDSPRGPMMIDPQTRDVVQTVYFRRVEKVGGKLTNVIFEKFENVKDPPRN